IGIGGELAAQVHVGLGGVLVLVKPFGRGLPDVDLGAGDGVGVAGVGPARDWPWRAWARALTNSSGPGVGERTIEPPFSVRGESSRQNGPSRLAVVSVAPFLPLLSRHTKVDTPSEPDASTASLWNELELWPIELMMAQAWWNSSSVSFTSRTKACRCLTRAVITSRKRGLGARSISLKTACVT